MTDESVIGTNCKSILSFDAVRLRHLQNNRHAVALNAFNADRRFCDRKLKCHLRSPDKKQRSSNLRYRTAYRRIARTASTGRRRSLQRGQAESVKKTRRKSVFACERNLAGAASTDPLFTIIAAQSLCTGLLPLRQACRVEALVY